jgi:hypothetical protein
MNRALTASARHHTYLLFSRLFLDGITDDLLHYLEQITELAVVAPRPFDPDESAAAHYGLFAHDIFPNESIFRDVSGLLGSIYADQVNAIYQRAGYYITADYDHIGHEIAYLAFLCQAEFGALDAQEIEAADYFVQLQASFLRDHLLYWLSPLTIALSYSDQSFFGTLAELTQKLVYDHLLSINHRKAANLLSDSDDAKLVESPDILRNNETNLKQIANFLVTPPYCGLYLGRSTIAVLARECQLPRGFGSRQQMLSNLLHSAAQYDLVPNLLEGLATHTNSWGKKYEEQIGEFPKLSPWIQPWLQQLKNTTGILLQMRILSLATA